MRAVFPLTSLALMAALALPVVAQTPPAPVAQMTVTGEGTTDTAPDMATLSLGVTHVAATASEALAANSAAVRALLDTLTAAGIEGRDIQTSGLSLNPNWTGYDSGSTPRIDGFTAQNMVTVRVRALDRLGAVLDAAVRDGANTLNGLSFGLADPDPAAAAARAAAVADAQARAEVLADAAGVRLVRVLTISEGGGYAPPQPMFRQQADMASVPVAGGEVSVGVQVSVTWEIAPK